jgi:hypothetical protein
MALSSHDHSFLIMSRKAPSPWVKLHLFILFFTALSQLEAVYLWSGYLFMARLLDLRGPVLIAYESCLQGELDMDLGVRHDWYRINEWENFPFPSRV